MCVAIGRQLQVSNCTVGEKLKFCAFLPLLTLGSRYRNKKGGLDISTFPRSCHKYKEVASPRSPYTIRITRYVHKFFEWIVNQTKGVKLAIRIVSIIRP